MSKKKTFALRIDDSVYSSVEQWAADEFRSVNGQLEWMIREQLKKAGRLKTIKKTEKDIVSE
ncbi:MAG: Arc family DNA binding domain-containing protein [Saprospiraceae bacterium]|nr:Arc family DNA binding domain-containing protein [Saprospiraceae bacterium]